MRILLDTHAFLWWIMDDSKLSDIAREHIEDGRNEVLVSAATGWEIAIKCQLKKLKLPNKPGQFVAEHISSNSFSPLPITLSHALNVYELPMLHRDPFDRILVSQCQLEKLPMLTADQLVVQYGVEVIW